MTDNITAPVLEKLARYDTPTICNVIELFEVRPNTVGYMDGRIRAAFPEMPPMIGFAATAEVSIGGHTAERVLCGAGRASGAVCVACRAERCGVSGSG